MTTITTKKLAELVAFKARLQDADEATLLGIERALVEVVYLVRQHAADQIETRNLTAAELRTLAAVEHLGSADIIRARLHGYLVDTRRQFVPFGEEVFPPEDSKLQLALAFRETRDIYEDALRRWERLGRKAGDDADHSVLSSPSNAGKPVE